MEQTSPEPRDLLNRLWDAQRRYNDKVKLNMPQSPEYWAKQYLLGLVSQVDEVLREINWKSHRKSSHRTNYHNLARELADLTKFVLCLWQLYDFTADDLLSYSLSKTEEMNRLFKQEFEQEPLPANVPVLISDVDGTLADWRAGFLMWYTKNYGPIPVGVDQYKTLQLDVELHISYENYAKAKHKFEMDGGYLDLPPMNSSPNAIHGVHEMANAAVFIFTRRPRDKYSRLWNDTWQWLSRFGLDEIVREIRIGGEERIDFGVSMLKENRKVVLLEDEPTLAIRAAEQGIKVFTLAFPYNDVPGMKHPNIHRVKRFNVVDISRELT